jgi:hypothetical protein
MHLALALPRGAGHWCHLVPRRTLSDRTNGSVTAVTKTKFFHPPPAHSAAWWAAAAALIHFGRVDAVGRLAAVNPR